MKAYHGKQEVKDFYINRVREHRNADEIIKGKYWEEGKGCAVGCTIHGSDHSAYETELGIPGWLAKVEDTIFEGLASWPAKIWPGVILNTINPGSNLESIRVPFLVFIMKQNLMTMESLKVDKEFSTVIEAVNQTKAALKQMIRAQATGLGLIEAESAADSALSAAYSAASSAYSARSAYSAARSSALSAARLAASSAYSAVPYSAESANSAYSAASSAARLAASSAYSAAYSAQSAALSVARSSASSAAEAARSAAYSVAEAARSAAYSVAYSAESANSAYSARCYVLAKELLRLIRNCKSTTNKGNK